MTCSFARRGRPTRLNNFDRGKTGFYKAKKLSAIVFEICDKPKIT